MQSTLNITELFQYGERVTFQKGDKLTKSVAGEVNGDIYILSSGICALSSISADGKEASYLYFKKQQFVGFTPLMTDFNLNYYGKKHFQSSLKHHVSLIVFLTDNFKNFSAFPRLLP